MERQFVCIECPRGCALTVTTDGKTVNVTGNFCPRGKKYAEAEVTCPRRVVTSSVRGMSAMIPVKTRGEVKKENIFAVMKRIRALRIQRDVALGEVLDPDIDGEGTPLIATAQYHREQTDGQ